MNDRLDEALSILRSQPPPVSCHELELNVWRGIDRIRQARAAAPALFAVRAAALLGALGLGVASGGATASALAAEPQEMSAFSVNAQLAPSTLLDHHK